jgi:hypothetical protein
MCLDHYTWPPNLTLGGFHNGKPLIVSMSGYNPLQGHYGGFVVADNDVRIILFFFSQFWLPNFVIKHG